MSAPLDELMCFLLSTLISSHHPRTSPSLATGHTLRSFAFVRIFVTDRRPRRMNTIAAHGGDGCRNCLGERHHQPGSRPARSGGHLRGRKGGERSPVPPFTAAPHAHRRWIGLMQQTSLT